MAAAASEFCFVRRAGMIGPSRHMVEANLLYLGVCVCVLEQRPPSTLSLSIDSTR